MKNITKEDILISAAKLVEQKGMKQVTLSDVGNNLGISHAALYKHFNNKQDLWTSLALKWLDGILQNLFPFKTTSKANKSEIAHAWLWTLAQDKMIANHDDPKMFELYTNYIDNNAEVLGQHMDDLTNSLQLALSTTDTQHVTALIQAFIVFSAPSFSNTWNEDTKKNFESIWELIEPGVHKIIK